MFQGSDRQRLYEADDSLLPGEEYTLYGGVADEGAARKVRGMFWTSPLETTIWFACCFPFLPNPAVYETTVAASEVYCYVNERAEDDFILGAQRCRKLDVPTPSRF